MNLDAHIDCVDNDNDNGNDNGTSVNACFNNKSKCQDT